MSVLVQQKLSPCLLYPVPVSVGVSAGVSPRVTLCLVCASAETFAARAWVAASEEELFSGGGCANKKDCIRQVGEGS